MTQPIYDPIGTGIEQLLSQSKRLGLTWQMIPATVAPVTGAAQFLWPSQNTWILQDNDTELTRAISLIGQVASTTRVMIVHVPPQGNYIIGTIGEPNGLIIAGQQVHYGETGSELITFVTQTSDTVAVTFTTPFASKPNVHTNINNGTGAASSWHSRAFSITTTGFTLFVFGPSSSWTDVEVMWSAFAQI